jgi:hypothetical protein
MRSDYWRSRSAIGQLEIAAIRLAERLGHAPKMVKDDRHATSIGCFRCDAWGCAEIDGGELVHGDVFEAECGIIVFSGDDLTIIKETLGGE